MIDVTGDLNLDNYDLAMQEALGGVSFLPIPIPSSGPYSGAGFPNELRRPVRQIPIDGVCGQGIDENVILIFGDPEDVLNTFAVPSIRLKRTGVELDTARLYPMGRKKFRIPDPASSEVSVNVGGTIVTGYTHYLEREQSLPVNISYDVEVRARYQPEAIKLQRYVRYTLPHRCIIAVRDTNGVISRFTLFRESFNDISELTDVLDRYSAYQASYRLEANLDESFARTSRAMTSLQGDVL